MKPLKDFFIPSEYDDVLSELKDNSFSWKMEFSSKSNISNTGQIAHYSIRDNNARGNFVLVPGLASNTEIEPLMRAITYWALSHKYNIYALDTFLGDFRPEISRELADKNTIPEFIDLMDAGLDIVSKMSVDKWTCVIGHSLGGVGTMEVFNRRVLHGQSTGFSGAVLFAPFVVKSWLDFTKNFMKHYQCSDVATEEFNKTALGIVSPHDLCLTRKTRYISVYPKFYDDIDLLQPRPDLMAQYDIPITFVAGGLDKKSPPERMREIYNMARASGANIKFVEFPNSRHSFINQHKDWSAILRLIKSQHTRAIKDFTK